MARRRLSDPGSLALGDRGGSRGRAAAVVGALVFQPWLLFIDVRVDDEIPAAVATAPAAAESDTAERQC